MRKKLDTRFPAARIKKIMQADEDVGKIAMAVPLLVSKALELFLQDLCDRTYEITLHKGAKTLNSMHLKQCVLGCNVFDFLRDIVGKVPDLGGSDATGEEKSTTKRRKVVEDDHKDGDEDSKRDKPPEPVHVTGSSRGRGRGRGRPRGKTTRVEKETNTSFNYEPQIPPEKPEEKINVRDFDLNLDLNENGSTPVVSPTPATPVGPSPKPIIEMKPDEFPGFSMADMEKIAIDPVQLANLSSRVDEDDEDYDE